MPSAQLIGILALTAMLGASQTETSGPSFDECLRVVSTGPESFLPYLCLGTPGLPDHTADVRAALVEVLRRKPREPHARIYLALIDTYAGKNPHEAEFTEPLAAFERNGTPTDVLLA